MVVSATLQEQQAQNLRSKSTFGNTDIKMICSRFVHLDAAVTDNKHGAIG